MSFAINLLYSVTKYLQHTFCSFPQNIFFFTLNTHEQFSQLYTLVPLMKRYCVLFFLLVIPAFLFAQKIRYDVSFPNLAHHEANIAITLSDNKKDTTVFRMSRSSPGRYATHEFGKNVYHVSATDKNGNALAVDRFKTDEYAIIGKQDVIKLNYTLYGNHADGTYADIDPSAVLMNIPASFMWVKDCDHASIELKFHVPNNLSWTIATQMQPTSDPTLFTAPGLQYFMDCPVLMGDLTWRKWNVKNADGKSAAIRLAFNGYASDAELDAFTDKLKRIILEQQAVFGELPAYDYGTYTFLASVTPYVIGDGMEHRNSTMITTPGMLNSSGRYLSTFSHEFFHSWNVERIRPASIEPFDFTQSNISDALWFAEGFTQYYGLLTLIRAGYKSLADFSNDISGWVQAKSYSPAGKTNSPVEMSRAAVYADAGSSIDRNNRSNSFISYYSYGAAIALALDLELRAKFGTTLDVYMQQVWQKFGKPAIPYQLRDLQQVLTGISNKDFAHSFFENYIYGCKPIDYEALLQPAGFMFIPADPSEPWIGNVAITETTGGIEIAGNSIIGSPLYNAGIDIGDQLKSIDGQDFTTQREMMQILGRHRPGEKLSISFIHRGVLQRSTIEIGVNEVPSFFPGELMNKPATAEMLRFRNQWLGSGLSSK
jgi:predicted metalloprotease with PDZ domain